MRRGESVGDNFMSKGGIYLAPFSSCNDLDVQIPIAIDRYSMVKRSKVGAYSSFGCFSWVVDCEIGRYVSIGSRCSISPHEHPKSWLSTSGFQYRTQPWMDFPMVHEVSYREPTKRTIIESDAWVGDNVFIRSGVHVGLGAIIGAGSVVVKDVPEFAIVAGNPAKVIRYRFEVEIQQMIRESKWWHFDQIDLSGCPFSDINDALNFIKRLNDIRQ